MIGAIQNDAKRSCHVALGDDDERIFVGLDADAEVTDPVFGDELVVLGRIFLGYKSPEHSIRNSTEEQQGGRESDRIDFRPSVLRKLKFSRCGKELRYTPGMTRPKLRGATQPKKLIATSWAPSMRHGGGGAVGM